MVKDPAGYDERKRIAEELPRLSRRQRAAFAAGCAERVMPLLENYLGHNEVCEAAIALTWRFALGETLDNAEVDKVAAACNALIAELYEDDETGATLHAANAAIFALESTRKLESKFAAAAASDAQDAATFDVRGDEGETHVQEEVDWQMKALEVTAATPQPKRGMFKPIASEPNWLRIYRRDRWIQR